ncbi:glycosyltransferase [Arenibacter certesii]|uniref:Glycosyl transferase n=1 Tax=Arenibacter certesii TaxID=228955 RepID=A0A918J8P7_9FLAO|nr:glycosyltransferase [Arenibacter certesii]GGW51680.1 glycosyl transferase [Arenibacter certesii]
MNKLLQINSVVNTGSTGRIAEDIGDYVMSMGWKSYIAYGRYGNKSNSHLIKFGSKYSNYWHAVLTRLFDKHGFGSKKATKRLIHQIEKINPDIIHLHNLHGYYINIQILFDYLATKSTPIVWTLHDCWSFTGHCVHFDNIQCYKWQKLCSRCPQKNTYPKTILYDNSKINYKAKKALFNSVKNLTIVPVSYWLQSLVEKSFLKENKIKTIHNGVDTAIFNKTKDNSVIDHYNLQDKFIILGVANIWSKGKGLNDFIRLSKSIEENEIIVLIGLNHNQINMLPKHILGIKQTESLNELRDFYCAADVFVNPSYQDSFGMVNIEALSCGTPVITYHTGGCPETISEETGYVVEQGNIDELLSSIRMVKNLTKDQFSNACRKRAQQEFEKNLKYKEYFELYTGSLKTLA